MNTRSGRRRPSSTRASPELVSTMMSVAASRGRSARTLAAAPDADLASSPVMEIPCCRPRHRLSAPPHASSLRLSHSTGTRAPVADEGTLAPTLACLAAEAGCGREHFETQGAGGRYGLDQPHAHGIAKPIARAAAIADQGMQVLAMPIVVLPDRGRWHEAIRAALAEPHEQSHARHPGDAGVEGGPDALAQVLCDQPIHGLTLSGHRAPLRVRELRGDFAKALRLLLADAAGAEPQGLDQRAMDEEIGIAPNWRGKMRVAGEIEAEVPGVQSAIGGLRLGAQHDLVDELARRQTLGALEHAVEVARAQGCRARKFELEARQEFAQRDEFFLRGRLVHTIDHGSALCGERFGGGDVGRNYELFDQTVRLEPFGNDDAAHAALSVEDHLAFGQIQKERFAAVAGDAERGIGCPQRS